MDEVMREYFEKIKKEGFLNKGELPVYDLRIEGEGCKGSGDADEIVFYLKLKEGIIEDISYTCNYCIPPSYIIADILCKFAKNKKLSDIKNITPQDVEKIFGNPSEKIFGLLQDLVKAFPD